MKLWWVVLCAGMMSCVSMKKYKDLETAKAVSEQKLNNKVTDCETRNTDLLAQMAELDGRRSALEKQIGLLLDSLETCQSELSENEAFIKSLGDQLDEQKRKLGTELEAKNKMLQQKEIVEKPLRKPFDSITFLSGVTILGDGHVCLAISIPGILNSLL